MKSKKERREEAQEKMYELMFEQIDDLVCEQMPDSDSDDPCAFDEDAFTALYTAICEEVFENRDSYPWWSEEFEEELDD